jgi:predicted GNAT family N-acyltransferase
MSLRFRPFAPADAATCLAVFDSNVPTYFAESERAAYATFLDECPCTYLVGESADGSIVACGGWFRTPNDATVAGLAWGMLHRDLHGRGLGRQLLDVRLAGVRALGGVRALDITTSQHTERFFARAGFAVTGRERDGHAPGIDRVDMRLDLAGAHDA